MTKTTVEETDDFEGPRPRRGKKRGRAPERVTARTLVREVAWLDRAIAAWPGASPPRRKPDDPELGPAPKRSRILSSLKSAPAGLYAIDPDGDSLLRIDAALIGRANWALLQARARKRNVERLVGDLSTWTAQKVAMLPTITACLQALASVPPHGAPRAAVESLVLEEAGLWIAGDDLRPSASIEIALLRPFVDKAPIGTPGRALAAMLLGRRRPNERLPPDLLATAALGRLLKSWPLDAISFAARAVGGIDALLKVVRANPSLDTEAAAASVLELALDSGASSDLAQILVALPRLTEAIDRASDAWTKRRALLLQMVEPIFDQTTRSKGLVSQKQKKKEALGMLDSPGGDKWRADLELLEAALQYSGDPFGAIDGISRWYLGMPLPETMVKGAVIAGGPDPRAIRAELRNRLARLVLEPTLDASGFAVRFTALAARLARRAALEGELEHRAEITGHPRDRYRLARRAALEGELEHRALLEAMARWIGHCVEACAPGSGGDGALRVAWRAIAHLTSKNEPPPWSQARIVEVLADHGGVLLERVIARTKERKEGPFDATSEKLLIERLTNQEHRWPLADLGYTRGLSKGEVGELVARDLLDRLGGILKKDAGRIRPLLKWLKSHTRLMEETIDGGTHFVRALFLTIDDPVVRELAQRWCNGLSRRTGWLWKRVGALYYVAFDRPALYPFLRKHFFVVDAITDAAFAAPRAGADGSDQSPIDFFNGSKVLDIAWKWDASGYSDLENLVKTLLDAAIANKFARYKSEPEINLAVELSDGDPRRLLALLQRASPSQDEATAAQAGWDDLKKHAAIARLLRRWSRSKDRVGALMRLLASWVLATRLPAKSEVKRSLTELDRTITAVEACGGAPQIALLLLEKLRGSAGEDEPLPHAIREILDRPQALRAELQALERRGETATGPQKARRSKLEALLSDWAALGARAAKELKTELPKQIDIAAFSALKAIIKRSVTGYWERTLGTTPKEVEDPDWVNALHLVHTVKRNRRVLKQLLRLVAAGTPLRIREHEKNRRFLEEIEGAGLRAGRWLDSYRRARSIGAHTLTVQTEEDPLKVLQMGNLFGTCLSAGAINAFSAVANAVEVNKRVLYVRDDKDRVVARKLLVLLPSGVLLGYASYGARLDLDTRTSLGPWPKILLDLFCAEIASSIGARFPTEAEASAADGDTMAGLVLFAGWYNDGTEPYDPWIRPLSGAEAADGAPSRLAVLEWTRAFLQGTAHPHDLVCSAVRALIWLGDDARSVLDRETATRVLGTWAIECIRRHTMSAGVRQMLG